MKADSKLLRGLGDGVYRRYEATRLRKKRDGDKIVTYEGDNEKGTNLFFYQK